MKLKITILIATMLLFLIFIYYHPNREYMYCNSTYSCIIEHIYIGDLKFKTKINLSKYSYMTEKHVYRSFNTVKSMSKNNTIAVRPLITDRQGKMRLPFIYFYSTVNYPRFTSEPVNLLNAEIKAFEYYIDNPMQEYSMEIQQENLGYLIILWTIIGTIFAFVAYYIFNGIEKLIKITLQLLKRKP